MWRIINQGTVRPELRELQVRSGIYWNKKSHKLTIKLTVLCYLQTEGEIMMTTVSTTRTIIYFF